MARVERNQWLPPWLGAHTYRTSDKHSLTVDLSEGNATSTVKDPSGKGVLNCLLTYRHPSGHYVQLTAKGAIVTWDREKPEVENILEVLREKIEEAWQPRSFRKNRSHQLIMSLKPELLKALEKGVVQEIHPEPDYTIPLRVKLERKRG